MMNRALAITLLFASLLFAGQGCIGGGGGSTVSDAPVTLDYWRVYDPDDAFTDIIRSYQATKPNVRINYRELRPERYEEELVRAIAEGNGPDIFTLPNTKLREYQNLIAPMPSSITVTELETRGTLRREVVPVSKQKPTLTTRALRNNFVDQVTEDVLFPVQTPEGPTDVIHGLPLALDTLVLYYNRDLLNEAGIAQPAENWSEFQGHIELLTDFNSDGSITQHGVGLGTAGNVDRATDILSLIMMQAGVEMSDSRGRPTFANANDDRELPALDALTFYTDFANPVKSVYTWEDDRQSALNAFTAGQAAYFIGYSYHEPIIRAGAPQLNFAVSTVPQIAGAKQVNFANYWVETVADTSQNIDTAWDFLLYATDSQHVTSFLDETSKPTARKDLISNQVDDEFLGPFAEQVLTAVHWYKGEDIDRAEEALEDLIDNFLGAEDPEDLLNLTQSKVEQTY
jgi:multiple sugar transport system substrate-binding protein